MEGLTTTREEEEMQFHDPGSWGLDLTEGIGTAINENSFPGLERRLPWKLRVKTSCFQKTALSQWLVPADVG